MPRPRFHRLDPERQRRILDVAAEEFADHGFEGASYNRIIERAGLSKGAMYYYFDDKADLYASVLDVLHQDTLSAIGVIDLSSGFWAGVHEFYRRSVDFTLENPRMMALARSFLRLPPSARGAPAMQRLVDCWKAWLASLLEEGRSRKAVRDDLPLDLLVDLVIAADEALDRWFLARNDGFDAESVDQVVDRVMDVHRRILSPAPEAVTGRAPPHDDEDGPQ